MQLTTSNKLTTRHITTAVLIIILKNIYYFFIVPDDQGIWALNSSLLWMWRLIFESYLSAFATIGLFLALVSAIKKEMLPAFYFIAVTLLLTPFHEYYRSYQHAFHPEFVLPYPDRKDIGLAAKIRWLLKYLSIAVSLFYIVVFIITAFISAKPERHATLIYKIILGMFLLSFTVACFYEITIWTSMSANEFGVPAAMPFYVKGIIFSSMMIWVITIVNFLLVRRENKKLYDWLFYISMPLNLVLSLLLYRLMHEDDHVIFRLIIAGTQLIQIPIYFLYRSRPRNYFTVFLPVILVLVGALFTGFYTADYSFGFAWPTPAKIAMYSIVAVMPTVILVMVPLFAAQVLQEKRIVES